jgi:hypothetical protein
MPAAYDSDVFDPAVNSNLNPKTRVASFTHLEGAARFVAIKDLPSWQQIQEMASWFGPYDVVVSFLRKECNMELKPLLLELVKMGLVVGGSRKDFMHISALTMRRKQKSGTALAVLEHYTRDVMAAPSVITNSRPLNYPWPPQCLRSPMGLRQRPRSRPRLNPRPRPCFRSRPYSRPRLDSRL